MSEQNLIREKTERSLLPQFLPALLLLSFGSGCAALIYEVVWFQLLELVVGSTAVSLGMLLGIYMGGLCLGSLALPRVIAARQNPVRVYAFLEAGIGVCGVLVLFAVPWVARVYTISPGHGLAGVLLRGAVCASCLVPPTVLMGSTLPAISRTLQTTPQGVSWLGFFYGANIAGAVFGCLLAGFYLLRVHNMTAATGVAVAINGMVALVAFALAAKSPPKSAIRNQESETRKAAPGTAWVYLAIALSGFCALSAEVVWTRLLSLLLGATVYTFAIILSVYLVGLGIGTCLGSFLARGTARPGIALGCCQALLTVAVAWTAYMLALSLPYWPIRPALAPSVWFEFQLDLARSFWAILPATMLWGASFPLALAAAATRGQDPGWLVGKIYAANTAGAILGALVTSLLLIAQLGTACTQQILIGFSALSACLMFLPLLRVSPADLERSMSGTGCSADSAQAAPGPVAGGLMERLTGAGAMLGAVGLAGVLAWFMPVIPWRLVAHGHQLLNFHDDRQILYLGEGMNAWVAVTEISDGVRAFHISGKVEASTDPRDMRLQRMLGHLPALFHPKPRSVLIVGCGAGVTAGCFVTYPEVERITICEIEPLIPQSVAPFFVKENYDVLKDPRVQVIYDDARHYVLTTKEKFDVITSDPIHPWVKGAATLYTREYFELCRQHLNPGGLIAQWVPLYESNTGVVKSELATFFEVFPDGTVWGNDNNGEGYDTVVLGGAGGLSINVDELQQRLARNSAVAESLRDVGFKSALGLLTAYAGRGPDLKPWLIHAEINRDRNLRLQYLAGMTANLYEEGSIYDDLLFYRRFPDQLFAGSPESMQALREALKAPKMRP